ncbi:MAG: ABC transporter permease [Lachnospiraceae bacterium]|nr:ABC transporter permease [Lachnospiraceae bacterium]
MAKEIQKQTIDPKKNDDVLAGYTEEELFARVPLDSLSAEKITAPRYSYWHSVFRVFFRKRLNIVILSLLAVVVLMAYVYPALVHYDPFVNIMNSTAKHLGPKAAMEKFGYNIHNILGTGGSGESTFDAIWYGSRISISLAFISALINMVVGVLLGAVWGFSKRVDMIMTQVYNIIANVPSLLVIAVLIMLVGASFWSMVFAFTITGWLFIAYFIRTQVVIIRDREYNLASKCLGTSTVKIAFRNILPFMTSIIVTLAASEIPGYISSEVFLAYIGMGLSDKSLGVIISEAQSAMVTPGWEFEFWSPVAITAIISVVLYVAGQNLGDASDPRTHM